MIYGNTPLLFGGKRCGNIVAMSLNDPERNLPNDKKLLVKSINAFGTKVGPYDLITEAAKRVDPPSF
jgi:hypothetical protein